MSEHHPSRPQPARNPPWTVTALALRDWLPGHASHVEGLEGAFIAMRTRGRLQVVHRHPEPARGEAWALEAASTALAAGRRAFTWCGGSRATRACAVAHPLPSEGDWSGAVVVVMRSEAVPPPGLLRGLDDSVARLAGTPSLPDGAVIAASSPIDRMARLS